MPSNILPPVRPRMPAGGLRSGLPSESQFYTSVLITRAQFKLSCKVPAPRFSPRAQRCFPCRISCSISEEAGMRYFKLTTFPDPRGPTPEVQAQHPQLRGHQGQSLVKNMWFPTSFFLGSASPMETMSCGSSLKHLREVGPVLETKICYTKGCNIAGWFVGEFGYCCGGLFCFRGKAELKSPDNTDLVCTFVGQAAISLLEPVLFLQPGSNTANPNCSQAPHSTATQKVVIYRAERGTPHPIPITATPQ